MHVVQLTLETVASISDDWRLLHLLANGKIVNLRTTPLVSSMRSTIRIWSLRRPLEGRSCSSLSSMTTIDSCGSCYSCQRTRLRWPSYVYRFLCAFFILNLMKGYIWPRCTQVYALKEHYFMNIFIIDKYFSFLYKEKFRLGFIWNNLNPILSTAHARSLE